VCVCVCELSLSVCVCLSVCMEQVRGGTKMSENKHPPYGFQVITDTYSGKSVMTCFEGVLGKKRSTNRVITTTQPQIYLSESQREEVYQGFEQTKGELQRFPVLGGKTELVTNNGILYFIVPNPEVTPVHLSNRGTSAWIETTHEGIPSKLSLYAHLVDEEDSMIKKLKAQLRNQDHNLEDSQESIWPTVARAMDEYGSLNLVQAVRECGLFPEQIYLTNFGRQRTVAARSSRLERTLVGANASREL